MGFYGDLSHFYWSEASFFAWISYLCGQNIKMMIWNELLKSNKYGITWTSKNRGRTNEWTLKEISLFKILLHKIQNCLDVWWFSESFASFDHCLISFLPYTSAKSNNFISTTWNLRKFCTKYSCFTKSSYFRPDSKKRKQILQGKNCETC